MFRQDFEIILPAPETRWTPDNNDVDPELISLARAAAEDLVESPDEIDAGSTAFGRGADGLAVLLIFSALGLFLQGKRIEENLDAWSKLAKRLGGAISRLRKLTGAVYLSEPAGAALAFQQVLTRVPEPVSVTLLSSQVIVPDTTGYFEHAWSDFRSIPERYYLYAYEVNGTGTHLICLESTGELQFHHILPTGSWMAFYGSSKDEWHRPRAFYEAPSVKPPGL